MTNTILELKKDDFKMWLSQYIDLHRYEITFTVTISTGNNYYETNFKQFKSACNYFNRTCINAGLEDYVIW